jgi:hypothetical protein
VLGSATAGESNRESTANRIPGRSGLLKGERTVKPTSRSTPALFLVLLTNLAIAEAAAGANWPIVDFKVIHGPPDNTVVPDPGGEPADSGILDQAGEILDELLGESEEDRLRAMADRAWSRLVEGFLGDAARRYAAEGLVAPSMPVVVDEGVRKYAVYLYDFPPNVDPRAGGFMNNFGCALQGELQWMSINKASFVYTPEGVDFEAGGERLDEKDLYITLAHELFHAIQGTYDSRYNSIRYCEEGSSAKSGRDVVLEGGAQGAAVYIASRRWPNLLKNRRDDMTLGKFEYSETFLSVKNGSDAAYLTGSFWRFLADRYDGLEYMDHLLRQPVEPGATHRQRGDWLDRGLESYDPIGEHLYILYPHAMTEIGSYGGSRYSLGQITWQGSLFQLCEKLELDPQAEGPAEVLIEELKPIASRCLELRWKDFAKPRDLKIEAIVMSTGEADQLHLGMSSLSQGGREQFCWEWRERGGGQAGKDTCLYEKVFVQTGPQEDRVKTWLTEPELFTGSGEATLVLSSIAPTPSQTEVTRDVLFRVQFAKSIPGPGQEDLAPPTGQGASPASGAGMGAGVPGTRSLLYGIRPGAGPISMTDLSPIEVLEAGPDGAVYSGKRRYTIVPLPEPTISPGYTGPLRAIVGLEDGDRVASNGLCADAGQSPVGQVLRADEKELRLQVNAAMCEYKIGQMPPFPVTDHLRAQLILPFGWRYFAATTPRDLETPGIQIYMDRYHDRMAGVPEFQSILEMVGMGSGTGGGGDSGGGSGGGSGSGGSVDSGGSSKCDCSCEALAELQEQCRALDGSDIAAAMECGRCMQECISALMSCGE